MTFFVLYQVKEPVEEEVSDLLELTSQKEDSALTGLLSSGKTQEAKQMIMAVSSLINTSPVVVRFEMHCHLYSLAL